MAIQDNQGMEAYLMLRWSDDCGETWSNQLTASTGTDGIVDGVFNNIFDEVFG